MTIDVGLDANEAGASVLVAHTQQVTVGDYAGVPLQDPGDTWRNGAVFLLRKPARASCSVSLDGWLTTVVRGHKAVITCGPSTGTDFEATFTEALNAANRGLDYLSVTGQGDCVIRDAPDDCLVWWPSAALGGVVMRCQVVQPFGIDISMTGVVKDANGNILPSPPPPTPMADDAFRFVRMARTSDDLFDAYRNLFLAFESLLSDLRPRRQVPITTPRREWWRLWGSQLATGNMKWETEHNWFMDALDHADRLVSLATLTPPGVTNHKKWISRWMYSAERSALMHAKRGQNYLLPHDARDRAELIESLGRLWQYIKNLIEKHLHVRGRSSSLSRYTVEHTARAVLLEFPLIVSDDDGPVNPEAENLIDPGATVVQLRPSTPRVDPDDPELWKLLAHCDAADLAGLTTIRRFGHMRSDGTGICEVLSELVGPLTLGPAVVRLEMDRGFRHVSPTGPPRQFSS
ncbi:hypothetical protein [Mycolicibacterium goodii]|uniref:hypothetical protein n=1 Tax=Mycolicibacterium goodii TaxID=134601 RepID=UPI001FEFE9D1|nr:hypothetical protein [Mycolicibacterium goodii]ULN50284.1 hypothetical protein MI170_13660 [Mycolicibacterium goodii]